MWGDSQKQCRKNHSVKPLNYDRTHAVTKRPIKQNRPIICKQCGPLIPSINSQLTLNERNLIDLTDKHGQKQVKYGE